MEVPSPKMTLACVRLPAQSLRGLCRQVRLSVQWSSDGSSAKDEPMILKSQVLKPIGTSRIKLASFHAEHERVGSLYLTPSLLGLILAERRSSLES